MPSFADDSASEVEVVQVTGVRQKLEQAGRLKDVIQKTEVLDALSIENKNALSLSEAINNEPGVNVSNECSMCGVKRVMLNGMKGEHTTILVDDLPTHTLISGFYAVDAIATTGVDRIEVARGAGASLIAPEAIGGTVNVITKQAVENTASIDFTKGSEQFSAYKLAATAVNDDGSTGLSISGQYDTQDQEDHDDNGVSEAPFVENMSLTALLSHDLNNRNNVQLRISQVQSEIFGGPMLGQSAHGIGHILSSFDGQESEQLFKDDDVRNEYIGKPWETTEWIDTHRDEAYVKWLTDINNELVSEFSVSYAKHNQDSFYEGIDYSAEDTMWYGRAKLDWALNNTHFLTFGADRRQEEMRSHTNALQNVDTYVSDSFDYVTQGIFIQDTWTPEDWLEVAVAVRIDHIDADFIDPSKPGTEISETFVAPRMDVRWFHHDQWTSRFSVGRGYRAPLSFFETDHGILDAELGYLIDVDELEESMSFNYSLSFDNSIASSTFSIAHSNVKNLASLEETEQGIPILTQLEEDASVTTLDWVSGYQVSENILLSLSLEHFDYNDEFKSSYSIAPIEERVSFDAEWTSEYLQAYWSTVWFGSRDLSEYGYEGYNIKGDLNSNKTTHAPSHSVSNIRFKVPLNKDCHVYAGLSNVFNYTQVEEGDTPLFFDANESYDVAYIYAPLHGREFYAGFQYNL
ncbi:TonB-dependent receptor plug domain-containing protein [Echinimonas agarilytica]|uniref:TonB-dependent receptor n=1 Tax=Echinimonas agarilytica TaxID=1215918 RepID=A0AA41W445_9GAMM|nr:TonB-dependent receptor [Echinimonas agarilytica]MCM2678273.1 TonB-dependent receptor [Echinimonas agarilytica]